MTETIKKEKGHFRRNWLFYLLLLGLSGFSGYLWISNNLALHSQAKAFAVEKTDLLNQAQTALSSNSEQQLALMMKTFVWAVRDKLVAGENAQVDQYFQQLAKSKKIEEVTLVDSKGKILLSTNKTNEGNQLATDYTNTVLNTGEMTVINKEGKQIAASPVVSVDSRLGTLIVVYHPDVFQLEKMVDLTRNE